MLTVESGQTTKDRSWSKWVVLVAGMVLVASLTAVALNRGPQSDAAAVAVCDQLASDGDFGTVVRVLRAEFATAAETARWQETRHLPDGPALTESWLRGVRPESRVTICLLQLEVIAPFSMPHSVAEQLERADGMPYSIILVMEDGTRHMDQAGLFSGDPPPFPRDLAG